MVALFLIADIKALRQQLGESFRAFTVKMLFKRMLLCASSFFCYPQSKRTKREGAPITRLNLRTRRAFVDRLTPASLAGASLNRPSPANCSESTHRVRGADEGGKKLFGLSPTLPKRVILERYKWLGYFRQSVLDSAGRFFWPC